MKVSLRTNMPTQDIMGTTGTKTTAAVYYDIGTVHCHDFIGTLDVLSKPPNWSFYMDATCASTGQSIAGNFSGTD